MFDVGFAEIFLLALIGLLVLGPERLPAVARTLGGFMRKARASWVSLRNTIEAELAEADIAAPLKETSEELKRIGEELKPDLPDFRDIPGFTAENRESGDDTKTTGTDQGTGKDKAEASDDVKDSNA
jgi:sec-independent protein translocase protein TatB